MKKIGIVGTESNGVFGVTVKYMQLAGMFGNVRILTPDDPIVDLDLLIMKGGEDIAPVSYGAHLRYILSRGNPYLDYFENEKLPRYIEKGTPIFGICRGLQALNVHFGGTLVQHLPDHPKSDDREDLVHNVVGDTKEVFGVNSLHHQCIEKLGHGLLSTHVATEGKEDSPTNIIEAIKHETLPIVAVQWHPEEILDDYSLGALERLLA